MNRRMRGIIDRLEPAIFIVYVISVVIFIGAVVSIIVMEVMK